MRRRSEVAVFVLAIIASFPIPSWATQPTTPGRASASGDVVTIYDPQDLEPCPPEVGADCDEDIRYVSLRSYVGPAGRSMLALTVGMYELYGGLIFDDNIKVRFDATGDSRPDGQLFFSIIMTNDIYWDCGPRPWTHPYRMRQHGDALTCHIPERLLDPTRPIRFRAMSRFNRSVVDRAPDQGWGGG